MAATPDPPKLSPSHNRCSTFLWRTKQKSGDCSLYSVIQLHAPALFTPCCARRVRGATSGYPTVVRGQSRNKFTELCRRMRKAISRTPLCTLGSCLGVQLGFHTTCDLYHIVSSQDDVESVPEFSGQATLADLAEMHSKITLCCLFCQKESTFSIIRHESRDAASSMHLIGPRLAHSC